MSDEAKAYFLRRARTEREIATNRHGEIARLHIELAELYEQRAAEYDLVARPRETAGPDTTAGGHRR